MIHDPAIKITNKGKGETIPIIIPDTDGINDSTEMHALDDNNCELEGDLIVDPLLKYLRTPNGHDALESLHESTYFNVDEAIEALQNQGYYHIPSVLTHEECSEALGQIWNFVEDVSGGCVSRRDPSSWYPKSEAYLVDKDSKNDTGVELNDENRVDKVREISNGIICHDPSKHSDLDPWPHTGNCSLSDMFQSLGAGYVLGVVCQHVAERIYEPLFSTRELLCSKEGFTFCRPLTVDLDSEDGKCNIKDMYNKHVGRMKAAGRMLSNEYYQECPELDEKTFIKNAQDGYQKEFA